MRIQSDALGDGSIKVTLTAGNGTLQLVRFGELRNAKVTIPGSSQPLSSNSDAKPPAGSTSWSFTVVAQNGPSAVTVPLTIYDGCGESQPWTTFVGGGQTALQSTASVSDAQATEGNSGTTNVTFTVKLSVPSSQPVSVKYTTSNGTANDPADYTAKSGTITFAPGETEKTIVVEIKGDFNDEGDETFTVALSDPSNGAIGKGTATARIVDDDTGPSASGDTYQATAGQPLTVGAGAGPPPGLLVNDQSGTENVTITSFGGLDAGGSVTTNNAGSTASLNNGGSLRVNADGSFSFTSPSNFTGAFSFRYRAQSTAGQSEATVIINVAVAGTAPNAVDDSGYISTPPAVLTVPESTGLLANDTRGTPAATVASFGGGSAGGSVTSTAAGSTRDLGNGGSLNVAANGSFTFTAPNNATGNFTFQYRLTNVAGSDDATVTIAVGNRPAVTAVVPANNAANIGLDDNVTVTFSEPVNVAGNWFDLACAVSGSRTPGAGNVAISGGPTTFTLNPNSDFAANEACTLTVVAAQVADQDGGQTMAANFTAQFTTDAAPLVSTTAPANLATGVPASDNITVTFSEPVNATTASFTIECPVATPFTYALSASPATTFTLNPTVDLPGSTVCTVTVVAAQITDVDAGDPPDTMAANHVFTFTTVDAAPTVTTISPVDAATNVATNANITVTFSEPVNIANAGAFNLECPTGLPMNITVTTPPILPATATTFVIDPNSTLPENTVCSLTVIGSQVSDADAADPPDTMTASFTSSFTTDAAPAVTSTTPANAAANVAVDADLTVNFSEPVNVTAASFTLECPAGTPFAGGFAVSGSGTAAITVNPTGSLPASTACRLTVLATQVSDVDAGDPPDTMAADVVVNFTTVDTAPTVTTVSPVDGATNVPTNFDIVVNFSEIVNITPTAFTISCVTSGAHAYTTNAVPNSSITLNPTTDFAEGELCTVTVVAAQVTDADAADPPDAMETPNVTFSFTTDAAPVVATTVPANLGTDVALNADVTINFSEPVDTLTSSYTISCTISGAHTFGLSASPATSFTLNPNTDFSGGEVCTVTVLAAGVTDVDAGDPPDQMAATHVFTFSTVDVAPTVLTTSPADTATGIATNTNVTVNFSESVNVTGSAFTISCATSGAHTYTTGASPSASFVLNPDTDFSPNELCTVTVVGGQVTDADLADPPDLMGANVVFSFTTDAAPAVVPPTTPANGATDVALNSDITIAFSEQVAAASPGSFTINCGSGSLPYALSASPNTSFTLNPTADLPQGQVCTVTVVATQVTDVDAGDPPDTMLADFVFSFSTVDLAPTVTTTVPTNGALGILPTTDVTVNFSESVNATTSSFTIECPTGSTIAYSLSASPAASFTLNPTADIPAGAVCTVTVLAAQITDADPVDPPDFMAANHVFTFTVPPIAANDSDATTGNVAITAAAPGVIANDTVGPGGTVTAVQGVAGNVGVATATSLGGSVILNADGSYTYDPPTGVSTGNDTFTYVISRNSIASNTATVTVTLTNIMWFVCDGCAGGNDGTLLNPFTSIGAFSAANTGAAPAPQPNHRVFIRSGTYDGASNTLALRDGQKAYGQGISAASAAQADTGFTVGTNAHADFAALTASTRPMISPTAGNGVTLAQNNTLRHVNASNTAGSHIAGANVGALAISDVALSGSGQALNLANGTVTGSLDSLTSTSGANNVVLTSIATTGTFNLGTGAVSGATARAFDIDGGTGTISYAGTIANTATGLRVANKGGGTVTFSGTSKVLNTGGNAAVTLSTNTGAVIDFTGGGLDIDTTSGTGFSATGGGTVTVQGTVNTIASTTGTALNVANTTIGAGDLTFQSIASNGGGNAGIVLNNTGTAVGNGGLTVAGTGAANSGGTIQNKTVDGITLNSTRDVSLSWMNITNNDGSGIFGDDVTNFSIISSSVTNNADTATGAEAGLRFNELLGTAAITNTTISGSHEDNVRLTPSSGTLTNLTVSGSTIGTAAAAATPKQHGLSFIGSGTSNATLTITNTTFQNNPGAAVLGHIEGTGALTLNVNGSVFHDSGHAITLQSGGSSDLTFNILNNTDITRTTAIAGNAIELIAGDDSTTASTIRGTISGNVIGGAAAASGTNFSPGFGIALDMRGDQDAVIDVSNNTVRHTRQVGIWASHADFTAPNAGSSAGLLDLTVRNNNISAPEDEIAFPTLAEFGVQVEARHGRNTCLDMANNTSVGGPNGGGGNVAGYRLRQRGSGAANDPPIATFRLERLTGSGSDVNNVQTFIQSENTGTASVTIASAFTSVPNGTCRNP